jgi:hypothetical protein
MNMMLPAGPSRLPNSPERSETPRIPLNAKLLTLLRNQEFPPKSPVVSDTESDDDREQIQTDAKIAAVWQDKERRRIKKARQRELKIQTHALRLEEKVKDLEKRLAESSRQPSSGVPESIERSKKKQKTTRSSIAESRTEASQTACMNVPPSSSRRKAT